MTVQTFRAFLNRLSYNLNARPYFADRDCYISRQDLLLHRRSACNEQLEMFEPAPVAHILQRDRIESLKAAYHYSGRVWKSVLQALYEELIKTVKWRYPTEEIEPGDIVLLVNQLKETGKITPARVIRATPDETGEENKNFDLKVMRPMKMSEEFGYKHPYPTDRVTTVGKIFNRDKASLLLLVKKGKENDSDLLFEHMRFYSEPLNDARQDCDDRPKPAQPDISELDEPPTEFLENQDYEIEYMGLSKERQDFLREKVLIAKMKRDNQLKLKEVLLQRREESTRNKEERRRRR